MHATLQLISHELCPYVQRSVIVLKEKDIPYQRLDIDLGNMPEWFKALSPMQRVPLLRVNDNKALFESAVICEYLDEITKDSMHPQDPFEKARHRAWIEFGSGILDDIGSLYNAPDKESYESKRDEIRHKFITLEQEITEHGKYFQGNTFHVIDAVYGPIFRYFDVLEQRTDLGIFTDLKKVTRWRQNLAQRDSVRQAVSQHYPALLLEFVEQCNSYLSSLIKQ